MKDKLRKLFEEQIKVTKANIKTYKSLIPVCILIKDNLHLEVIGFSFKNYEEKEYAREMIKKLILSQKIKGYMLFLDSKMTIMDNEGKKEPKIKDVVICLFCSPILRIQKDIVYDPHSRKILDILEIFDSDKQNDDNVVSEWDLYGKSSDSEDLGFQKMNEDYQKYKQENPNLYKEVK